jgi:hypothetical protein
MSVKYQKSRCFSQSLKNVAHWGYWENANKYMPGTSRENAVWIEALNGTPDDLAGSVDLTTLFCRRVGLGMVYTIARRLYLSRCCDG